MFLWLLTTGTGRPALAGTGMATASAVLLTDSNTIAWRQLNFKLDNLIPLLVGTVTLGHREQFTQTAAAIQSLGNRLLQGSRRRLLGNRRINQRGIFRVLICH